MRFLISILVFIIGEVYCQKKEILINGSFEDTIKLPNPNSNITDDLKNYLYYWNSPNQKTPELLSVLFKDSLNLSSPSRRINGFVPEYFDFLLYPFHGNNFAGFGSLTKFYETSQGGGSEYLQNTGINIKKSHKYHLTFKFAHYPRNYYSKTINVVFSNIINDFNMPYLYKSTFKNSLILDISLNESYQWDSVSSFFKSNENYNTVIFGNLEFANFVINSKNQNIPLFGNSSYINLDDISLIELPCIVAPDSVCYASQTPLFATLGMPYYWSSKADGSDTLSKDSVFVFNAKNSQWVYAFGKYGKDSSFIYVEPKIPIIPLNAIENICTGKQIVLNAAVLGNYKYLWSNGKTSPSITISDSGVYAVVLSSLFGCTSIASSRVFVRPLPSFYLPKDTIICFVTQKELNLMPSGNFTCLWLPVQQNSCNMILTQGQTISLELSSVPHGCKQTYTINVQDICEQIVFIPSVFYPKSEIKENQNFAPVINYYSSFKIMVFNRWGEQVFESEDINKVWDGSLKGNDCPQDVYLCVVEVVDLKKPHIKKKYSQLVHLLR